MAHMIFIHPFLCVAAAGHHPAMLRSYFVISLLHQLGLHVLAKQILTDIDPFHRKLARILLRKQDFRQNASVLILAVNAVI